VQRHFNDSFAASQPTRTPALLTGETRQISSIHAAFSKVSSSVEPTIMRFTGHLPNLESSLSEVLAHPIQEIVVINAIKTQSNLVKFVAAAGVFALASTAMALEPTTAGAPQTSWPVTYPVGYSDLDVSKLKGAKTLYLRIRHASEVLCESAATWGKKEGDACVRKSMNEAVARVDVPLLSQYYQLRDKGDKVGLVQLAKAN
jgi:UrcA family protein